MTNRRLIAVIIFALLLVVAVAGIYFINKSQQDLAIENTSASVVDQVKLAQLNDNLNQDRVIIGMTLNVLNPNVKTGKIVLIFDKNVLEAQEIISDTGVIATNQKVDNSNGTITYEFQSVGNTDISGEFSLGKVIFSKLDKGLKTSIKVSSTSSVGFTNTLDSTPVEISVSL